MSADNGGSAFPCTPPQDTAAGVAVGYPYPDAGMTLRDYFAAKAMQAVITKGMGEDHKCGKSGVPLIASYAYEYADAMLKERAK